MFTRLLLELNCASIDYFKLTGYIFCVILPCKKYTGIASTIVVKGCVYKNQGLKL